MAARRQELAARGEVLVVETCGCLRCGGSLVPLRRSKPCAVVRCRECGAPAQVRTRRWPATGGLPKSIMGDAAWEAQAQRLSQNRLLDLFVVLVGDEGADRVWALPGRCQAAHLFRPRGTVRSAGGTEHRSFSYDLAPFHGLMARATPPVSADIRVVCAFPPPSQRRQRQTFGLAQPQAAVLARLEVLPTISATAC